MTVFHTSDLHFGHQNMVARFNRQDYKSVEEMNEDLVRQWNKTVSPQDTVYVHGDIMICNPKKAIPYMMRLNGKIKLIPGNHDHHNELRAARTCGWEILPELVHETFNGRLFVMSHYPLASWKNQHHGAIMLFGHTHGSFTQPGMTMDVGLDSIYNLIGERRPVSQAEILEMLEKKIKKESDKQR